MKYFFIIATPRSGTTFISRAMDYALSTTSVIGDLILPVTCSIHAVSQLRNDMRIATAIEHGFESEIVRRSRVSSRFEALHRYVIGKQSLGSTFRVFKSHDLDQNFVFKEPFISFSPSLIREGFASGLFWLVRDGRDVANSLVETYNVLTDEDLKNCKSNENPIRGDRRVGELNIPWWVRDEHVDRFAQTSSYVRAGMMWAHTVEACRSEFETKAHVLHTRYEELVSDHESCIESICQFLSVPRTRRLVRACKSGNARSIGAFRRRSSKEVDELESVIGDTLEAFGYA